MSRPRGLADSYFQRHHESLTMTRTGDLRWSAQPSVGMAWRGACVPSAKKLRDRQGQPRLRDPCVEQSALDIASFPLADGKTGRWNPATGIAVTHRGNLPYKSRGVPPSGADQHTPTPTQNASMPALPPSLWGPWPPAGLFAPGLIEAAPSTFVFSPQELEIGAYDFAVGDGDLDVLEIVELDITTSFTTLFLPVDGDEYVIDFPEPLLAPPAPAVKEEKQQQEPAEHSLPSPPEAAPVSGELRRRSLGLVGRNAGPEPGVSPPFGSILLPHGLSLTRCRLLGHSQGLGIGAEPRSSLARQRPRSRRSGGRAHARTGNAHVGGAALARAPLLPHHPASTDGNATGKGAESTAADTAGRVSAEAVLQRVRGQRRLRVRIPAAGAARDGAGAAEQRARQSDRGQRERRLPPRRLPADEGGRARVLRGAPPGQFEPLPQPARGAKGRRRELRPRIRSRRDPPGRLRIRRDGVRLLERRQGARQRVFRRWQQCVPSPSPGISGRIDDPRVVPPPNTPSLWDDPRWRDILVANEDYHNPPAAAVPLLPPQRTPGRLDPELLARFEGRPPMGYPVGTRFARRGIPLGLRIDEVGGADLPPPFFFLSLPRLCVRCHLTVQGADSLNSPLRLEDGRCSSRLGTVPLSRAHVIHLRRPIRKPKADFEGGGGGGSVPCVIFYLYFAQYILALSHTYNVCKKVYFASCWANKHEMASSPRLLYHSKVSHDGRKAFT